ncbi:hypothetical protein D3C75_654170 [compost metagenome]
MIVQILAAPLQLAVVVQQVITGHHFIEAVSVQVIYPREVARIALIGPQQVELVVQRPQLMVPVLQNNVRRALLPGQIGNNDAVMGFCSRQLMNRLDGTRSPVENMELAVHHTENLQLAVAVDIIDLRRIIGALFACAGIRLAGLPQQLAGKIISGQALHLMRNVTDILAVVRLNQQKLHPAVTVQVPQQQLAVGSCGLNIQCGERGTNSGFCRHAVIPPVNKLCPARPGPVCRLYTRSVPIRPPFRQ